MLFFVVNRNYIELNLLCALWLFSYYSIAKQLSFFIYYIRFSHNNPKLHLLILKFLELAMK